LGQNGTFSETGVNSYFAIAGLILAIAGMLTLPLIPSIVELRNKSDAKPLNVIQEHAGEIRHFAAGFRAYIAELQPSLQQCVATGASARGVLPDRCEYLILGPLNSFVPTKGRDAACELVILAGAELCTPDHITFSREIYAAEQFRGGQQNNYRAILGERNVHLGPGSTVVRWVHAVGDFHAAQHCNLFGRISSDQLIQLAENTSFLRLNAPRIELGCVPTENDQLSESFDTSYSRIVHRLLENGDYEIPAGEVVAGNVVVRGQLLIRSGARVRGSVKSHKQMVLEAGVCVEGSLISASKMVIGPDCLVHGPVIAEREMIIGGGSCCGTPTLATTVSSPRIFVEGGVIVFGTLWAREYGEVMAAL
jgi:cytoskeletal protein CcmA (bactofilin family)